MTKDELEKEAEEFTDSKKSFWRQGRTCIASVKQAYIAGAEPREKQIEELERKLEQTEKDLADYQFNYPTIKELQKENAELKEKVSYLEDNLRVARKDREDLQLEVAKGLKEFVTDFPATAFRYLANEKYIEQLSEAKEIIKSLVDDLEIIDGEQTRKLKSVKEAEQFLKEV